MKILYVTTIGSTMGFFKDFAKRLLADGHTLDIATNEVASKVPDCYVEWNCNVYNIDCSRSPLSSGNVKAIKQIEKIVEKGGYDIVHCHTPIAAMCTRIACRKTRKNGTKVIYTAHGFHFYKGAPFKNWLIFYSIEKICSYFTDVLITINTEDYALAKKKLKAKKIEYVPGVGIDLNKFSDTAVDKSAKRKELCIPEYAKLFLSVGELNKNKNHETVIRAIADKKDVYYIIAGEGGLKQHLQSVAKEYGIENRVMLLGYRNDIKELCEAADVFVFPSFREGLSVSVMEAMASGLPVLCSKIRGNTDLIDQNGGVLFNPYSLEDLKNAIDSFFSFDLNKLGLYNTEKIKGFSLETVNKQLLEIYSKN